MKRFFRSIPRVFRMARTDMKRHFSMTFSSILSIAIALLLCVLMAILAMTTNRIAENVEGQLQLQVSVSPVLSDEQKHELQTEIEQVNGVVSATYSSKEEELASLIEENGEMFAQYQETNPLYDVYIVELSNLDDLTEASDAIAALHGVVEVSYGGAYILQLVSVFQSLRLIGWLICLALIGLCIFLIRNTVRMTIMVRQDEISIMRTVGASSGYIVTPFLIEGVTMGFWGALIPAVLIDVIYPVVYNALDGAMVSSLFSLYPPYPFLLWITAADFLFGILLGLFGAWMAARKYVRRVR